METGRKRQPNIYLTGFMGAGKSVVGEELARQLNREFYDTDKLIEQSVGVSIVQIFEKHGEEYFRDIETEVIRNISNQKNAIIALGGGAVISQKNRLNIENSGILIYLKWDVNLLLERILSDLSRPQVVRLDEATRKEKLIELFNSRKSIYEQAKITIYCKKIMSVREICSQIVQKINS